jgi:hypothetical protein
MLGWEVRHWVFVVGFEDLGVAVAREIIESGREKGRGVDFPGEVDYSLSRTKVNS